MMKEEFFQAIHSPVGAESGFAMGYLYHGGGFATEQDNIPEQNLYIGIKRGNQLKCLPFFAGSQSSAEAAFTQKDSEEQETLDTYRPEEIQRNLGYGTDTFQTGDLCFQLFSPVRDLPDPLSASLEEARLAFCPAILAQFTIDNSAGKEAAEGFFAVSPMQAKFPLSAMTGSSLRGFCSEDHYGFAVLGTEQAEEFCDFGLMEAYRRPEKVMSLIAPLAGLAFSVAPGESRTIRLAFGWYHSGIVTGGMRHCSYWYCRYFPNLTGVLDYTLQNAEAWVADGQKNDSNLESLNLSPARRRLICQSVHSYYLSSILLDQGGTPRWVMDEGTFRMMNTFDLTVDHAFFELRHHPWAVRDQLDTYLEEYSYHDQCGLTFTHDQGTHHVFSPRGYSSYELPNLTGCFSYMSQEQLCNWILTGALYIGKTKDLAWTKKQRATFAECLSSMLARDSQTGEYTGVMDVDSSRCGIGREITTYDSLDESLGQASENLYMAMKCWASYIALETVFTWLGEEELAQKSREHAKLGARTIESYFREDLGFIPAVFQGEAVSAIIPAIEALIYPDQLGRADVLDENGDYAGLIALLKRHMETVLQPGLCLFPDGGWKLSSTSTNSWISKIFLCEYVAEYILHIPHDYDKADRAHELWWKVGCPSNPGIDQILDGTQPARNFHYPRCITSDLWVQKAILEKCGGSCV